MSNNLSDKIISLEIIDMNESGQGIAKKNGWVYFVNGTVIGDIIDCKITIEKKNYRVAEAVKLLCPSEFRKPGHKNMLDIPYGLSLRKLEYKQQLNYKENHVYKTIDKISGITINKKNKIIGLSNEERYRNKGVFPVRELNGKIKIGSFKRGSHSIVEELDNIAMPKSYALILDNIKKITEEYRLNVYNELRDKGGLKFITIRSNNLNEHLIILNFKDDELSNKNVELNYTKDLVDCLKEKNIKLAGIVKSLKNKKSNSPNGGFLKVLYGNNYIFSKVTKSNFKIGVESFFQVSTEGVEKLYAEIFRIVNSNIKNKNLDIWDIYCGVGSIGIYLSNIMGISKIKGLEIIDEAIEYAKYNAKLNGINEFYFETGKAEIKLGKWVKKFSKPDLIIVDPPRKGLDKKALEAIIKTQVEYVLYVSCKASTLARDLKILTEYNYRVLEITPVDIFPMTMHVECVVLLQREKR